MSKFRDIFRGRPKYVTVRSQAEEGQGSRRELPDGLWTKCEGCGTPIYHKDLAKNLFVCEKCGFHHQIGAKDRIAQIVDDMDAFEEFDRELWPANPLQFPDYEKKTQADREKTGLSDAIMTGKGTVGGYPAVLIAFDFFFRGGSMGSVVGEKVTRAFERATEQRLPVIAFPASGGARMQEGLLSLMQMAKTNAALTHLAKKGLPYISVLTDPTMGGVSAGFAFLGDVVIAEPKALIGFAGPRVIESTVRVTLPEGFQRAEFLQQKGAIDFICDRRELRKTIANTLAMLQRQPADAVS